MLLWIDASSHISKEQLAEGVVEIKRKFMAFGVCFMGDGTFENRDEEVDLFLEYTAATSTGDVK